MFYTTRAYNYIFGSKIVELELYFYSLVVLE